MILQSLKGNRLILSGWFVLMTTAFISKSISRQNRNPTSPNSVNSTRITLKKREREKERKGMGGKKGKENSDAFANLIIQGGTLWQGDGIMTVPLRSLHQEAVMLTGRQGLRCLGCPQVIMLLANRHAGWECWVSQGLRGHRTQWTPPYSWALTFSSHLEETGTESTLAKEHTLLL